MSGNIHRLKGKILLSLLSLLFSASCCLGCRVGTITISEIGMCTDYDHASKEPIGIISEYPAGTQKLMVYFYSRTDPQVDATYRWYRQGKLMDEFTAPLDLGYNFGWIISKREPFPSGNYTVEINLGQVTLRSTEFRILSD